MPPVTVAVAAPRALVVDDSPTVRKLHTFILEDAGFEVEAVERGDVALARVQEHTFDVVVAGFSLRGLDGLALVRGLRGMAPYAAATLLLMSADVTAEQTQQAIAAV